MDEGQELMRQTLQGVILFFADIVQKTGGDLKMIHEAQRCITNDWDVFYLMIKEWLLEIAEFDKKSVLESFVKKIPQLIPYTHLLEQSLVVHDLLWETVFRNVMHCKLLLIKT